jgi:hypothetical protein
MILRDYLKIYVNKKAQLKKAHKDQRVCLTFDTHHSKILIIYVWLLIRLKMVGTWIKEF